MQPGKYHIHNHILYKSLKLPGNSLKRYNNKQNTLRRSRQSMFRAESFRRSGLYAQCSKKHLKKFDEQFPCYFMFKCTQLQHSTGYIFFIRYYWKVA